MYLKLYQTGSKTFSGAWEITNVTLVMFVAQEP